MTLPPSGVLFGCARGLFNLIPRVLTVCKRMAAEMGNHLLASSSSSYYDNKDAGEFTRHHGQVSHATEQARLGLVGQVSRWQPECSSDDDVGMATAGRLYQLALSALLYTDCYDPHMQDLLNRVPDLLQLIPATCSVSTVLCWPLSVIGSVVQADGCRFAIRDYLVEMSAWYKFANIRQTVELLDELWSMTDPPRVSGGLTVRYMMKRNGNYFILA